ncbi:UNVERIFIED_CONTAM: hypothetical protein HDU68_000176 [Siphonaria sp. JEL0065]|nr:hypothetical protein HDU68_000176 [Siphonaria sp. JEL0065]
MSQSSNTNSFRNDQDSESQASIEGTLLAYVRTLKGLSLPSLPLHDFPLNLLNVLSLKKTQNLAQRLKSLSAITTLINAYESASLELAIIMNPVKKEKNAVVDFEEQVDVVMNERSCESDDVEKAQVLVVDDDDDEEEDEETPKTS